MTDDVINNKSFLQCVASTQSSILFFLELRDQYKAQIRKQRRSRLQRNLEALDCMIEKIHDLITKACKIVVSPSVGLDVLTQSYAQKQSLLLQIGQSLLALKKEMSKRHILNDLRRRICQQKQRSSHDELCIEGHNTAEFTWKKAYDAIDEMETAGIPGKDFPLNFMQLR